MYKISSLSRAVAKVDDFFASRLALQAALQCTLSRWQIIPLSTSTLTLAFEQPSFSSLPEPVSTSLESLTFLYVGHAGVRPE